MKPNPVGRPKKPENQLRKKRYLRLTDDESELISQWGGSLQEFVDHHVSRLIRIEKNRKTLKKAGVL
jgi:hypothetical protein